MKKNIAIIMGGYSSEHDISVKSGEVVFDSLNKEKYNVYKVLILPKKWVLLHNDEEFTIDKDDFTVNIEGEIIHFDCVFNAIHGHPGENGVILAYLDLLNIPHTSAPFYQMALTFNKRDTLSVLKQYGIKTAQSVYFNKGDEIETSEIVQKVGLPCFVKPNNAGSSFGISKVYEESKLMSAIDVAFEEDSEILIESFLDGVEVSVGVIEYQNKIIVLPMTEIVSENDFFDYEAKYLGKSQEITPARISEELRIKIASVAEKVYKILRLKGFSRAEYIVVNDEPHFIEINTVPGMTKESILPQQANAANISLPQLFDNAIEMALK